MNGSIGPGFQWNILNYGRIRNNVRANEAKFYQLVFEYQSTVLAAAQEVEDGIVSFRMEKERLVKLNDSATQEQRSVDIATVQYREGSVSFQPVVYMQQILARRQDELASSRGSVAANLVSIYKALGGGWQTRMNAADMLADTVSTTGDALIEGDVAPLLPVDAPPPVNVAPLEAPPVP